jgi:hypothetical protein
MNKNLYDTRSWMEVVGDVVDFKSSPGDGVQLHIQYHPQGKPTVQLYISTFSKGAFYEDISAWIPDQPFFIVNDEERGFPSWREFVESQGAFGQTVRSIIVGSGRNFVFKEVKEFENV